MARIRTIKPEFCISDQITECSLMARLLFVQCWMFCDDRGIHPLSFKRLKAECFPMDSFGVDVVEEWFLELEQAGLVSVFEHDERLYFVVTGWHHQKIDRPSYKYPDPQDSASTHRGAGEWSLNDQRAFVARHPPEGSLPESTGVEGSNIGRSDERPRFDYPSDFKSFWETWPKTRRNKKRDCLAEWKRAKKRADVETVIAKAREFANSPKGQGPFCPEPTRWLRGNGWEDDPVSWQQSGTNGSKPERYVP